MAIINPNFITDPLGALGTQWGVPTCVVNFTQQAFGVMSAATLQKLQASIKDGRDNARSSISNVLSNIYDDLGIFYYDAGTGKLTLFGPEGRFGIASWSN